jgi:hypothetical protein
MVCDIIKPAGAPENNTNPNPDDSSWEYQQDPDSGAIVKRWKDLPETVGVDERRSGLLVVDVPLMARGIIDGGIRVAGTTERFGREYVAVDFVKATFGPDTIITKRDQVTNIRSKRNINGPAVWREEEISGYPPTVFNVMGVTPVFDPFSNLIEQAVLLERAEVQGG